MCEVLGGGEVSGFCGGKSLAALNLFLNQPSAVCVFQDYDTFFEGAGEGGGEGNGDSS